MTPPFNDRAVGWVPGLVHLAFFTRYSLAIPLVIALLAFFGWKFRTNAILGNVFLVDNRFQLFQLTWLSLVAVALAIVEARVTLLNARERFPDCPAWNIDAETFSFRWMAAWIVVWLVCGLSLPLVSAWATLFGDTGEAPAMGEIVGHYGASAVWGVVLATALMFLASGVARFSIGQDLSAAELMPMDACFRHFSGLRAVAVADSALARIFSGAGYAEPAKTQGAGLAVTHQLRPGHAQLAFTLLLALAGYLTVYWMVKPSGTTVPVLFYVLMLLVLAGALLTAASFFLDLYRLPVPIILFAVGIALSLVSQNDHFFAMLPCDNALQPPLLIDVAGTWAPSETASDDHLALPRGKDGKRTLVVVAAAGGGIQAAAWTAKVLTELHARYGIPLTRSVRLVSGVSGGSVGLMFYLDRYRALCEAKSADEAQAVLAAINEKSRASSLEATAWGIAFYDLVPTVLPVRRYWPGLLRDRGTVLEDLWASRLAHSDQAKYTVRGMLEEIQRDGHPIAIFNSTNGSTGARFLWSPVRLIERDKGRVCDPEELVQVYPDWDLSVVSAARLSATFSYVSPICRPVYKNAPYPRVPFADGGYAENEGILAVIQALTQLLSHYQTAGAQPPPFDRILIMRILPFAGDQPFPRTTYDQQDALLEERVSASAWRRALTGPLELLTEVRQSSQSERGEWETAQMQAPALAQARRWATSPDGEKEIADRGDSGGGPATMQRWLEPFAVTHNLIHRQKTGEGPLLGQSPEPQQHAHPLRERADKSAPAPLQIASIKFSFALPGQAAVSHSAKLVLDSTSNGWDDYFTPLSWKMSPRQKDAIDAAWQRFERSDLTNLSPLDEPLFFAPGDSEPSLTLDDVFGPPAQ